MNTFWFLIPTPYSLPRIITPNTSTTSFSGGGGEVNMKLWGNATIQTNSKYTKTNRLMKKINLKDFYNWWALI